MDALLQIWVPVVFILTTLGCVGMSWFFYVRSINIPWDPYETVWFSKNKHS